MSVHTMTPRQIATKIQPILKKHGVTKAAIFGSAARGEMTPDSDLDLLVESAAPFTYFQFYDLQDELENALGVRVDLINPKYLKPRIKAHIASQSQFQIFH